MPAADRRGPLRLLLLGPPGVGKGTQAERLADHYSLVHVSSGDLLRAEVEAGTPLGREAARYMDAGDLVPDDILLEGMVQRLVAPDLADGYVADGFPRTVAQAEKAYAVAREHDITVHAAISLQADDAELVRRMQHRATQMSRSDDTPETLEHRLQVFRAQTAPLLDYYAGRGILITVDAGGAPDAVFAAIVDRLRPVIAGR